MNLRAWVEDRLDRFEFSLIKARLRAENRLAQLKSLRRPPLLERGSWKEGAPICVFVIYQRHLRPDTRRVLDALSKRGVNVVAVLTRRTVEDDMAWLRLHSAAIPSQVRYGRDFGGYRAALQLLRPEIMRHERLLLLNDSVYISSSGRDEWLDGMLLSPQSFIGATENHDGEHHLGSFCLSFGPKVLQSKQFWKFWRNYKPSNLRPQVIKDGELALCRCVFRIVEHDYRVLYSAERLADLLSAPDMDVDALLASRRAKSDIDWPTETFGTAYAAMAEAGALIHPPEETRETGLVTSAASLAALEPSLAASLTSATRRLVMESVFVGSQIHQNCMTFRAYLGMPLVKCDLYYRGILGPDDIFKLTRMFPESEQAEIRGLLLFRTAGFKVSWRKTPRF